MVNKGRFKNMLGDMQHDRHAHAIATDMVGVVIALRKPVIVVQPVRRAASRGDSRRDLTVLPSTTKMI